MRIALTGNPNSGKTTMYNALTGRNEKVGNWAGVTVEKKGAPDPKDVLVRRRTADRSRPARRLFDVPVYQRGEHHQFLCQERKIPMSSSTSSMPPISAAACFLQPSCWNLRIPSRCCAEQE